MLQEDELDFHLFTGAYRCVLHHFRRDIAYTDVRRLVIPSTEGPAADGALIRRYLIIRQQSSGRP